jgi:hypothetical protein
VLSLKYQCSRVARAPMPNRPTHAVLQERIAESEFWSTDESVYTNQNRSGCSCQDRRTE